jgi:hypothetical protein
MPRDRWHPAQLRPAASPPQAPLAPPTGTTAPTLTGTPAGPPGSRTTRRRRTATASWPTAPWRSPPGRTPHRRPGAGPRPTAAGPTCSCAARHVRGATQLLAHVRAGQMLGGAAAAGLGTAWHSNDAECMPACAMLDHACNPVCSRCFTPGFHTEKLVTLKRSHQNGCNSLHFHLAWTLLSTSSYPPCTVHRTLIARLPAPLPLSTTRPFSPGRVGALHHQHH